MASIFEERAKQKPSSIFEQRAAALSQTPSGLTPLDASATPTMDSAEAQPTASPQLLGDLQQSTVQQMPTPVVDPNAPPPAPRAPVDMTQVGLDSAEAGLTTGGMILGASLAAAPETGGASLLIPAVGAILGYGIGKGGSNLLQRAVGRKAPLNNLPEAALETGQNLKEGATVELTGRAMGAAATGIAQKVLSPLGAGITDAARSTMEYVAQKAEQYGMKLTPAELTNSKGLQLLENFLSNVPFSAGKIQDFRTSQLEALVKQRENIIQEGGGEKALEEIGLRIRNLVDTAVKDLNTLSENNLNRLKDRVLQKAGSPETYHDLIQPLQSVNAKNIDRLRAAKNMLYDNAKDLMPDDLTAVPKNLVDTATKFRDELLQAAPALRDNEAVSIMNSMAGVNNPLNAQGMIANRKALNDLIAKNTNFATGEMNNVARMFRQMIDAIDQDMGDMAKSTGNQTIVDAWDIANKGNADYKNYVKDPLVKKIAEGKKPDAIVGAVYSPGNDTEIKKFQQYYGKDFADRAKKVFTNSFLGLTPDPSIPDAPLTGDFIRSQMQRYGTTLNSIYSDAEINYFRRVAGVLDGTISADKEIINNPVMKSIIASPRMSGIVDIVVKPKDVGNVALIKQYAGKEGLSEVQNALLNKFLVKNQLGNFAPQTFAKEFGKYEPRVLQEVFPKNIYEDLKSLQTVSTKMGGAEKIAGNPSGTARNLLIPVGIGFMLHNPLTTGSLILGSRAITELYLSDIGRKWLTTGFMLPATADKAAEVAGKITMLALEHQRNKLEKKQGESQ